MSVWKKTQWLDWREQRREAGKLFKELKQKVRNTWTRAVAKEKAQRKEVSRTEQIGTGRKLDRVVKIESLGFTYNCI